MKQGIIMEQATELEFLKFFFDKVRPCLGPADDDIIRNIKEQFMKKTGKSLPQEYAIEEEEPDYQTYTLEEFETACKSGGINNYDGSAYLVDAKGEEGIGASCRGFSAESIKKIDPSAVSVHWYPK